jgi:hypothetical protein
VYSLQELDDYMLSGRENIACGHVVFVALKTHCEKHVHLMSTFLILNACSNTSANTLALLTKHRKIIDIFFSFDKNYFII